MPNSQSSPQLKKLIANSLGFQRVLFYGMAIVFALAGIILLIMTFTLPVQPGEENIVQILRGASVVFILAGIWAVYFVRQMQTKIMDLIYKNPEKIKELKAVRIQKNGIAALAVHIISSDGKKVGLNVMTPQDQQELMTALKDQLGFK